MLFIADKYLPHIHGIVIPNKPLTTGMRATLMMVTAIVIHNFPEGFATGTAYSGGAMGTGKFDDPEAEILKPTRETVGGKVPVVTAHDLHGNVSQ